MKTIVITGASDGIGAAAAEKLCKAGHQVIIVGRNPRKTEAVAQALHMPFHIADFARLEDVCRLASELSAYRRIDVLANNAGGMQSQRRLTEDGFEATFQINALSPFLLTKLLMQKLCDSRAAVIQTTSIAANLFGRKLDMADLQNEKNFTPVKAYGEAKLCNILFTRELQRRYGEKGICAAAFEPGIPRTNFASEASAFFRIAYHSPLKYLFTGTPEKSADRMCFLALGTPGTDFIPGQIYSGKKLFSVRYPDDGTAAIKFWEQCENMVSAFGGANG